MRTITVYFFFFWHTDLIELIFSERIPMFFSFSSSRIRSGSVLNKLNSKSNWLATASKRLWLAFPISRRNRKHFFKKKYFNSVCWEKDFFSFITLWMKRLAENNMMINQRTMIWIDKKKNFKKWIKSVSFVYSFTWLFYWNFLNRMYFHIITC